MVYVAVWCERKVERGQQLLTDVWIRLKHRHMHAMMQALLTACSLNQKQNIGCDQLQVLSRGGVCDGVSCCLTWRVPAWCDSSTGNSCSTVLSNCSDSRVDILSH